LRLIRLISTVKVSKRCFTGTSGSLVEVSTNTGCHRVVEMSTKLTYFLEISTILT